MTKGNADQRSPRRWRSLISSVAVMSAAAGLAACFASGHDAREGGAHGKGDCVTLVAADVGGELHAKSSDCDVDSSFTVAQIAGQSGECRPRTYTQISPPFTDVASGKLCLVPNLVVGHCYRYGVPRGRWDPVDCDRAGPAAIEVTKRVDSDDPQACPTPPAVSTPGIRTVPAPQELRYPARVYCMKFTRDR